MTLHADADVAVVGLGPTGLLAAALLGAAGVRVLALEQARAPHGEPRAVATDDEVLRTLQGAGIDLGERLLADPAVELVGADGRARPLLVPRSRPYGHPRVGLFHQPDLEAALAARLAALPGVEVRRGVRVGAVAQDAAGVTLEAGGAVRAGWVLACDGARSALRAACGIRLRGATAPRPWLVVDGRHPLAGPPRVRFVGDPTRPAVSLPLPGGRHRWEFMLAPGEEPDPVRLLAGTPEAARAEVVRAVVYLFHARVAARWRAGRVLLLGDAAHLMPPFAGQGWGAGARDAANLAWKLAAVVRGEAGEALLDTYETERRPGVLAHMRLARLMGALLQTRRPGAARARDRAVGALGALPVLGPRLLDGGARPRPVLRRGALGPARPGRGRLLPQPLVLAGGRPARLDDLLGAGWALVGVGAEPPSPPPGWAAVRVDGPRAAGAGAGPPQPAAARVRDPSGALGGRARVLVVRPDRYVHSVLPPGAPVSRVASAS